MFEALRLISYIYVLAETLGNIITSSNTFIGISNNVNN
jgi:hypothetical protein